MASLIEDATIQIRRDSAANWATQNPVLASGEWGLETDTARYKIGDGSTAWNSLSYADASEKLTGTTTQLCKAWVNFDGTTNVGGFCTIRDSFNVASVTDNGTGDYTITFTNAMSNANYSANFGCKSSGLNFVLENGDAPIRSTSQLRIYSLSGANVPTDNDIISVQIFGSQ